MKTNFTRKLRSAILCLALLAAAIPFTAFGFGAAARAAAATPPKPDEVVIELYGTFQGKRSAYFLFEGNTILFNGDGFVYPNPPLTRNGGFGYTNPSPLNRMVLPSKRKYADLFP